MKTFSILLPGLFLILSACTAFSPNTAEPVQVSAPTEAPQAVAQPPTDTPAALHSAPQASVSPETTAAVPTETATQVVPSTGTPTPLTGADLIAPTPGGRNLQPQLANASIDVDQIQVLLPVDAIRAIFPEEVAGLMVPAAEADRAGLDPETQLIGVHINGESQAYPIPFLSRHEIVNAVVGGKLIAATW